MSAAEQLPLEYPGLPQPGERVRLRFEGEAELGVVRRYSLGHLYAQMDADASYIHLMSADGKPAAWLSEPGAGVEVIG